MNHQDYIKAARALAKIPEMERSPWVLVETEEKQLFTCGSSYPDIQKAEQAYSAWYGVPCRVVGPWLNIDDFSDWSAVKILDKALFRLSQEQCDHIENQLGHLPNNMDYVHQIIEAHKINPAAVEAAIPKE